MNRCISPRGGVSDRCKRLTHLADHQHNFKTADNNSLHFLVDSQAPIQHYTVCSF